MNVRLCPRTPLFMPLPMHANNFRLQDYFQRIGYTGRPGADLGTVTALMTHQLQTVPFENLDVLAGRGVSLAPEAIVDKLVHRRRGGYCFEVNGLFALALTALGVAHRYLGCRPTNLPTRRPRTHMALLLALEGEDWLCDLGFGRYGMRAPMRLADAGAIRQGYDEYQLVAAGPGEYHFRARVEGEWMAQYSFDLCPMEWVDFQPANWFTSTHPETLFTRHRIVMRQTPEGRVILFDDQLKTIHHGRSHSRTVTEAEVPALLRGMFGLEAV